MAYMKPQQLRLQGLSEANLRVHSGASRQEVSNPWQTLMLTGHGVNQI